MIDNIELLVSILNTKLRDQYSSLEDLCDDMDYSYSEVQEKLKQGNYQYSSVYHKIMSCDIHE